MPFGITCLLAPICLCLAVYRLVSIPLHLHSGALRLRTGPSRMAAALALLAYLALLGYTLWLGRSVLGGLPYRAADIAQIVRLVMYFEALPIIYILAEWRFFYGLQRVPNTAATRRNACPIVLAPKG